MTDTFGRFAALPIGPLLAARDGGLTLATTAAADLNRCARSDFALSAGVVGVEFALWGDDDLSAVVGFVTAAAPSAKRRARTGRVSAGNWPPGA